VLTLAIMASGTALIAFVPGYATIGLLAPFLVLIGRLLQGFSAGVELGGVSVYLSEMATPGNKGFYVSWQSASQQVAIIFSAALGYGLNHAMPKDRLPTGAGAFRSSSAARSSRWCSTSAARCRRPKPSWQAKSHPTFRQMMRTIAVNWQLVTVGMMLVVMTTVAFYMITVYTPTFGKSVLKLSTEEALLVTLCVQLHLAAHHGRAVGPHRPLAGDGGLRRADHADRLPCAVAGRQPSFGNMLMVELWLSFLYGSYNGATVVALTESSRRRCAPPASRWPTAWPPRCSAASPRWCRPG
jgi:MHS family citrate/tricarballylate:H+ symporter-like MFS transporter